MAFDGIVTKSICKELSNLTSAKITKIYEPTKNNITIGMYLNGLNYCLNISIDSSNYRINLTTKPQENPKVAPNFCMVLRKNLLNLELKKIYTLNLDRIIVIEFEGLDDISDLINKKLIIELMGKHSNIILLDDQNIIIDSLRHIKTNSDNYRDILPHIKYDFPKSDKQNFLSLTDFNGFYNILQTKINNEENQDQKTKTMDISNIPNIISSTFTGISKNFVKAIINNNYNYNNNNNNNKENKESDENNENIKIILEYIYTYISNILKSDNLSFSSIYKSNEINEKEKVNENKKNNEKENKTKKNNKNKNINENKKGNIKITKDYYLKIANEDNSNLFPLNFYIDDFYYEKETREKFNNYKQNLLKTTFFYLNKYNKRLKNMNLKLEDCKNMDTYKLYGELITASLYKLNPNSKANNVLVTNYYDENNDIEISLDSKYTISNNAKKYYKKYNKLKNQLEIVKNQKADTIKEINYIESIIYEIENSSNINELKEINNEINENLNNSQTQMKNIKNKNKNKSKNKNNKEKSITFSPIKYEIDGYTVLVGRNNKENDYLTLKYANKSDIWFHVKDFHGSHVILKFLNESNHNLSKSENILDIIPTSLLKKVANIALSHSKAKYSKNAPVDYCEVRYVKKPKNSKPRYGYLY